MIDRGVMIFAFKNDFVDYLTLAAECARRVHKFLKVPVCVVTDDVGRARAIGEFDVVRLFRDESDNMRAYSGSVKANFRNQSRAFAPLLTPFRETIIIDSDYMVASDRLATLWGTGKDFLIGVDAVDLGGQKIPAHLSPGGLTAAWATVIYFKAESNFARKLFNLVDVLSKVWPYYVHELGIQTSVYRNDYSFALALQLMHGGVDVLRSFSVPFPLVTAGERDVLQELSDASFTVRSVGYGVVQVSDVDLHVIHKRSLLEKVPAR